MQYLNNRRNARPITQAELVQLQANPTTSVRISRRRAVVSYLGGTAEHVRISGPNIPMNREATLSDYVGGPKIRDMGQDAHVKLITKAQQASLMGKLPESVIFGNKQCGNAKRVTLVGPKAEIDSLLASL